MAIRLTDKIAGGVRGSVSAAMAAAKRRGAKRLDFLLEYFTELYRLCVMFAWDFAILVGQSANETGFWAARGANPNWETLGNPAGLAITNSENKSVKYKNGTDAARAHAVHWWICLYGPLKPTDYLYQFRNLDGHYTEAATGTNIYSTNRPYAASVVTIEDLNDPGQWALIIDERTGAYLHVYGQRVLDDTKEMWGTLPDQSGVITPGTEPPMADPVDTSKLVTGRVPHPKFITADVYKGSAGLGFDYVPARKNVGCCWHEWQGSGRESQDFIINFFGPNGERYTNALVDYAIMPDGTIIRLNNPEGTRSPWASGGGVESGGLEGDGPAFYNKFGLGAINSKLVSTEIVKSDTANYTEAQIQSAGALGAYWHDRDGQFYFEHPYTTKYGLVASFLHFEFGTTTCGIGEVDDITKVQAVTKGIMAKYQTGSTSDPGNIPPEVPNLPDPELPAGIPLAKAEERFNQLRKIDAKTGKVLAVATFDPKGVISLGWAQKMADLFGDDYDKWSAGGDWIVFTEPVDKTTLDIVTFDKSELVMLRKNEKAGFVWA